jgi:hypothetical protein
VQFASLSYIAPHSTSPRCGSGSETSQFLSLLSPSLSSSLSSSLCNYSQFYKKSLHPDSSYRRQLPQTFVFLTKHHAGMDPLPRIRCRVLLICLPSSIIMPPTPLTGQWCPTSTNKYNTRKRNPRRSISSKTLNKTTSGGTEHALPDRFFKNAEANMPRVDYEDFILFRQTKVQLMMDGMTTIFLLSEMPRNLSNVPRHRRTTVSIILLVMFHSGLIKPWTW